MRKLLTEEIFEIKLERQLYPITQNRALENKERTVALDKFHPPSNSVGIPVEMKNQSAKYKIRTVDRHNIKIAYKLSCFGGAFTTITLILFYHKKRRAI